MVDVKLERVLTITPAWDKTHPDPAKNYGQHCVDMRFAVKGSLGAIQFVLYTGWYPGIIEPTSHTDWSDWAALRVHGDARSLGEPIPADLGYHSLTPRYDGQTSIHDSCEYLGGKPCFYDGSGLDAHKPFSIMIHEGGDKLWEFLENYYAKTFAPVPQLT